MGGLPLTLWNGQELHDDLRPVLALPTGLPTASAPRVRGDRRGSVEQAHAPVTE